MPVPLRTERSTGARIPEGKDISLNPVNNPEWGWYSSPAPVSKAGAAIQTAVFLRSLKANRGWGFPVAGLSIFRFSPL